MLPITPTVLEQVLSARFPSTTSSWSQATDELRDMCREARTLAQVDESGAANFRAFDTPAHWNAEGVAATVKFYRLLDTKGQAEFCERFNGWLTSWCHGSLNFQPLA